MKTNLLKITHHPKGIFLSIFFCVLSQPLSAQPAPAVSAAETALSGAVAARTESQFFAHINPALTGQQNAVLLSFSPSSSGIAGYHDGILAAGLGWDSAYGAGVDLGSAGLPGYVELSAGVSVSVAVATDIVLGVALRGYSVAIDRYGAASALTIDAGAVASLDKGIRFGASVRNLTRSGLAGQQLPQGVNLGLAFDLDGGLTVSADLAQELRRQATACAGVSWIPLPGLVLRGGGSTNPAGFSLGIGYMAGIVQFEYGVACTLPLGIRHVAALAVQW